MSIISNYKNQILFLLYFGLSFILTWWFICVSPLYISQEQMLLSTGIAGGKWFLQIIAGLIFLKDKSWEFLKGIGSVCLLGSCLLIPYIAGSVLGVANNGSFFLGSLIVSVITMIFYYFYMVKKLHIGIKWWIYWILCLAIAISLQLTLVFHVFGTY